MKHLMFIQTCVGLYLDVDVFISFHIPKENELSKENPTNALFVADGKPVAAGARAYGFPVGLVYRVLEREGQYSRGTSHDIPAALKNNPAANNDACIELISLGMWTQHLAGGAPYQGKTRSHFRRCTK